MFEAVTIVCSVMTGYCSEFTDQHGPHKTQAACVKRLDEMTPGVREMWFTYGPPGRAKVRRYCNPVEGEDA